MDSKALTWIVVGVLLILGGLVSTLREEPRPAGEPTRSSAVRPAVDNGLPASTPETTAAEQPFASPGRMPDTGFEIDPIRGLRQKDKNKDYFG